MYVVTKGSSHGVIHPMFTRVRGIKTPLIMDLIGFRTQFGLVNIVLQDLIKVQDTYGTTFFNPS